MKERVMQGNPHVRFGGGAGTPKRSGCSALPYVRQLEEPGKVRCKLLAVVVSAVVMAVQAAELSLTSTDNSVRWDTTTAIWTPVGGGAARTYSNDDCDVAHIGPNFSGTEVVIGGWVGPKELRFNNTQTITLKNESVDGHGLSARLGVVNKYGTGTLVLDFSDWRNYESCDWHVYGGLLRAGLAKWYNGGSGIVNYRFCANAAISNVTIFVHDGGSLWSPAASFFTGFGIDREDTAPNVTVYTNGTLIIGNDTYSYSMAVYRDIILDGGNLDLTRRGSWGIGSFKVTRKLAFKGRQPYSLSMNGQDQKLVLAATRQTEFAVDDITGDAAADVTLNSNFDMGPNSHDNPVGFRKTGAGTLVIASQIANAGTSSARGPLGVNGTITIEGGTVDFANAGNTMEGKLEVTGGTLTIRNLSDDSSKATTYYGNMDKPDREIVASGTGKILMPNRYTLAYMPGIDGAELSFRTWLVARDGGTIEVGTADGTSLCTFGNLWLDGGDVVFKGKGEWPYGYGCVMGTMKFSGAKAYVFRLNTAVATQCQQLLVNNNSKTVFDVADITGDAGPDVTFELPLVLGSYNIDGQWIAPQNVGYTKRGTGTMRLNYSNNGNGAGGVAAINGTISVEAGTLQVDDGCQDALIAVASGAFVSGTGKVKALTLSDGAGFVVASGRDKRLSASGAASIGATGVVNILAEDVANDESLTVAVVDFNGTVAGTGNLSGWKVLVNGVEVAGNVYLKGRTLMAERNCGTVLIFR